MAGINDAQRWDDVRRLVEDARSTMRARDREQTPTASPPLPIGRPASAMRSSVLSPLIEAKD